MFIDKLFSLSCERRQPQRYIAHRIQEVNTDNNPVKSRVNEIGKSKVAYWQRIEGNNLATDFPKLSYTAILDPTLGSYQIRMGKS